MSRKLFLLYLNFKHFFNKYLSVVFIQYTISILIKNHFFLIFSEGQSDYELLGEGECRQADGQYPLKYGVSFHEFSPFTKSDNLDQAKEKCLNLCRKYRWCYAAEFVLSSIVATPRCRLTTDRPTFEKFNGPNQNYDYAAKKIIDGISYQTYCLCQGSNGSNWDGGKLKPRTGNFCFKKKNN